jgi:GNAT superfamily N-acetyltransferase
MGHAAVQNNARFGQAAMQNLQLSQGHPEADMTPQPDGFTPVPPGKIATIVTHLEMTVKPDLPPAPELPSLVLDRVRGADPATYRRVFLDVGGRDWLWVSRLKLTDAALTAILHDTLVELFYLRDGGAIVGLLELDFRDPNACELSFLGLVRDWVGRGAGRYLMNIALTRAWAQPITRLHVHTCTLDHPGAVGFYCRSGFTPVRQEVEVFDDPRLAGILPPDAAPHIPIIR